MSLRPKSIGVVGTGPAPLGFASPSHRQCHSHLVLKTGQMGLPGDRLSFSRRHRLLLCPSPHGMVRSLKRSATLQLKPAALGSWVCGNRHRRQAVSLMMLHAYSWPGASAGSQHRGETALLRSSAQLGSHQFVKRPESLQSSSRSTISQAPLPLPPAYQPTTKRSDILGLFPVSIPPFSCGPLWQETSRSYWSLTPSPVPYCEAPSTLQSCSHSCSKAFISPPTRLDLRADSTQLPGSAEDPPQFPYLPPSTSVSLCLHCPVCYE